MSACFTDSPPAHLNDRTHDQLMHDQNTQLDYGLLQVVTQAVCPTIILVLQA